MWKRLFDEENYKISAINQIARLMHELNLLKWNNKLNNEIIISKY